jgi:hypothetical protein
MEQTVTVSVADNDYTATLLATVPDGHELGEQPGEFRVGLSKQSPDSLTVYFDILGTASNSLDYGWISNFVHIAGGNTNAQIAINVIRDRVAETNETVLLALRTNGTYLVGSPSNAVVTIHALPYDLWKVGHFGLAQANSTNAADGADWDADGTKNLMEYVLGRDPTVVNTNLEFIAEVETTPTNTYFTIYYFRREPLYDAAVSVDVTTNLLDTAWMTTNTVVEAAPPTGGVSLITTRVVTPPFTNPPIRAVRLNATTD